MSLQGIIATVSRYRDAVAGASRRPNEPRVAPRRIESDPFALDRFAPTHPTGTPDRKTGASSPPARHQSPVTLYEGRYPTPLALELHRCPRYTKLVRKLPAANVLLRADLGGTLSRSAPMGTSRDARARSRPLVLSLSLSLSLFLSLSLAR